ncbi:hypothetical protein JCM16303_007214 [Sporobolomyces ruberrimus]
MPPRKKVVPAATTITDSNAGEDDSTGAGTSGIDQYELPKSVIARLAKGAVPPEVKLQKEVPLALVKSSTVFISYLAALSHDLAAEKSMKTITAQHVLEGVKQLGWEDGGKELEKYLKKELKAFRKINEAKKAGTYVAPTKQPKQTKPKVVSTKAAASTDQSEAPTSAGAEESTEPSTKTLPDDRPNADEGDLYPDGDEEMADEEEEGVEVYEEGEGDEEEDEVVSENGDDDGVDEPAGAEEAIELDDVDDEDD